MTNLGAIKACNQPPNQYSAHRRTVK